MELTPIENLAFGLLQARPDILQPLAGPTGNIEIEKIHSFYHSLSRQLEFVMNKRKGQVVDTTATVVT